MTASQLSAEDLRAEVARRRIRLYQLAAVVGLNPNRLGALLNERVPLTQATALRIAAALGLRTDTR